MSAPATVTRGSRKLCGNGGSCLRDILDCKRAEIELLGRRKRALERVAGGMGCPAARDLAGMLSRRDVVPVIAEIKRRSPSSGLLDRVPDPGFRARRYEQGGASALSVLTDAHFFDGSLGDLVRARACTSLPVLRKDFILDRLQLLESRAAGADAVLLIVSILPASVLGELFRECLELGMTPLLEVRDESELRTALDLGPSLVGINNRDLVSMTVDTGTAGRLAPLVPAGVVTVAESGISGRSDIEKLLSAGIDAFLIGSALMRSPAPAQLLMRLTSIRRGKSA